MTVADPSDPLGYDVYVLDDMAAAGRASSGVELVTSAIYHRITTGALLLTGSPGNGYVDYGEDVRLWIGEVTSQSIADSKAPRLALVIGRDERVDPGSIRVAVTYRSPGALAVVITCATTTGLPVRLVLNINDVSVDLLSVGV